MPIKSETPDEARERLMQMSAAEREGAQASVAGQVHEALFEITEEVQERIDKINEIGAEQQRLFYEGTGAMVPGDETQKQAVTSKSVPPPETEPRAFEEAPPT